ncbi:MAG: DUF1501 domain-containing protein [Planctomycetota bacterium]
MTWTRRFFLQSAGTSLLTLGLPSIQIWAEEPSPPLGKKKKIFVLVFLRGGMDGLNVIVPYQDPFYYKLRGFIALPRPDRSEGVLDLDGFFGLNPRLKTLFPYFQNGLATAINAVGYDLNSRSHFEEQNAWETGATENALASDGWLNRYLRLTKGKGPIRAVSIGESLPRVLQGKAPAYALRSLADLSLGGSGEQNGIALDSLLNAYQDNVAGRIPSLLLESNRSSLNGIHLLGDVLQKISEPSVVYPENAFAQKLKEIARLIKADVGLEVAEVDYDGWDTHQNQGAVQGQFGTLVQTLSDAVATFMKDLENQLDDILLLVCSEFGRTVAQNGSNGTDHGWGNCMLAFGGPVLKAGKGKARPVIGTWPGLAPEQLMQHRDLKHTTDFRDVFAEVLQTHLEVSEVDKILYQPHLAPVNLIA